MSTKLKIQKIRAEIEAHEERGWLKGYEEGLARREQVVSELREALEARNEKIRELTSRKKSPKTAREALELAWELAHPVKEGQELPEGEQYIRQIETRFVIGIFGCTEDASSWDEQNVRTLDPLPEPEPDWLDAPAVLASTAFCDNRMIWEPTDPTTWVNMQGDFMDWTNLRDVTPLYPKENA